VVLYNKETQEVHCLNRSAAIVWENADGTRSIDELASLVERELHVTACRGMVLVALDQLAKANLLERRTEVASEEVSSRRAVAKRLAMAGMSAAMLPIIASMTAPSSASAATTTPNTAQVQVEAQDAYNLVKGFTNIPYDTPSQVEALDTYRAGEGLYTTANGNPTQLTAAQSDFEQVYKDLGLTPPF
jgi:glycine cleavage system regulatory protein